MHSLLGLNEYYRVSCISNAVQRYEEILSLANLLPKKARKKHAPSVFITNVFSCCPLKKNLAIIPKFFTSIRKFFALCNTRDF